MSKIKEIFATAANKIAHNTRDKQFEEFKEQLVERINEAANEGKFCLYVKTFSVEGRWEELELWLKSVGFIVIWNSSSLMAVIKWDDKSIAKNTMTTELTRYCPNCGAKMKGE